MALKSSCLGLGPTYPVIIEWSRYIPVFRLETCNCYHHCYDQKPCFGIGSLRISSAPKVPRSLPRSGCALRDTRLARSSAAPCQATALAATRSPMFRSASQHLSLSLSLSLSGCGCGCVLSFFCSRSLPPLFRFLSLRLSLSLSLSHTHTLSTQPGVRLPDALLHAVACISWCPAYLETHTHTHVQQHTQHTHTHNLVTLLSLSRLLLYVSCSPYSSMFCSIVARLAGASVPGERSTDPKHDNHTFVCHAQPNTDFVADGKAYLVGPYFDGTSASTNTLVSWVISGADAAGLAVSGGVTFSAGYLIVLGFTISPPVPITQARATPQIPTVGKGQHSWYQNKGVTVMCFGSSFVVAQLRHVALCKHCR